MRSWKELLLSLPLMAAFLVPLSLGTLACEREGPFERAGEEVDEAADETEDKIDDTFD